ncbi:MAG: hypothetical protein AAF447_21325, partial [Myxococcota bacterium]
MIRSNDARSPLSSLPTAPAARRGRLMLGLLDALLRLAEKPTTLGELALVLGVSATDTAEALLVLERRGLVRAERLRLTLTGLAAGGGGGGG